MRLAWARTSSRHDPHARIPAPSAMLARVVRAVSVFSATKASLRTRPSRSQSLQSRWAASSSSSARRPICAAMFAASAANASINESATARWDRLQSSCQRTTSPTRSKQLSISSSGVSQTVSASGILARSASVSGRPSSIVKANRPPVAERPRHLHKQRLLVRETRASSRAGAPRRTARRGIGGIRADLEATGKIAGSLAGDVDGAGAEVHPQIGAAQLPSDEPSWPGDSAAQVQHRDPGAIAGPPRKGPNLSGAHEALLLDELAGGVRRHAGSLRGPGRTEPARPASPPLRLNREAHAAQDVTHARGRLGIARSVLRCMEPEHAAAAADYDSALPARPA